MKRIVGLALLLACWGPGITALAADPHTTVNLAGVIDYPTALDQSAANIASGRTEAVDLGAPDLRLANLRYGRQFGNLQILTDAYWLSTPVRQFDRAELKLKLRVLTLDGVNTSFALGALARGTDQSGKDQPAIDNKPYSLLGIVTAELLPFPRWGPWLVNFYLDNRFADAGLKVQLHPAIQFVAEVDYHHANPDDQRLHSKAGFELEGEQNFYLQFLYSDDAQHMLLQLGTGF
jgi:hypothetical protein